MKNIKQWLVENGYRGVVAKIHRVEACWKDKGKRTRRNWWDVLAGRKNGTPIVVEGIKFPVLQAARVRKEWSNAPRGLSHHENELALPVQTQARWTARELKAQKQK